MKVTFTGLGVMGYPMAGFPKGSVIVDHTTASARVASEVYDLAQKKRVDFLDAPLSGGQAGWCEARDDRARGPVLRRGRGTRGETV